MYSELNTHLKSSAPLANILSTRIYSARLPDKPTYPCLVLARVTGRGGITHSGPALHRNWRVRISCYAESLDDAVAALEQVRAFLHGNPATVGSVRFGGFDVSEGPSVFDSALKKWGESLDVSVNWKFN